MKRAYPLLFSALLLLLAACGQDAQPDTEASNPSFSFSVDPSAGSAELKTLSAGLATSAACENGTRTLNPGDELELTDYDFTFLPGNILRITAAFTNTTPNTYEQPFSFSGTSSNVVSTTEPEVTDADLGSDGKLSPDETTAVLTFTVEHKGQAFSYGVSAEARVSCKATDPTDPTNPPEPVVCTNPVAIPDAGLEAAIRDELGKETGELICSDLGDLFDLEAYGRDISNLEGLQYAVSLEILDLSDNQLSTLKSNAFAGLSNLQNLSLYGNQLTTIESGAFAGLPNLEVLNLTNNPLGTLNSNTFTGLTRLQTLYFSTSQLTTLKSNAFAGLSNLEVLYLENNRLSTLERGAFDGLTNLQVLSFYNDYVFYPDYNQLSDISALSNLTNLQTLNLYNNQVNDISPLSELTNLQSLDLSSNPLSDIGALSGLTNLQDLGLFGNGRQLSGVNALANLTKLRSLDLASNQIDDISALEGLTKLQFLSLYYNQLTDISTLQGLTNLQKLDLYGNQLTDLGPLVANLGLGSGDEIILQRNCLVSEKAQQDVQTLKNRGAAIGDLPPSRRPKVFKLTLKGIPMNHKPVNVNPQNPDAANTEPQKQPYTKPELKEHGSAAEVTLQTFFGSFSP